MSYAKIFRRTVITFMFVVLAAAARADGPARTTIMAVGDSITPGAATREGNYMALNGISVSASNGLCKFMKTRKTASGNLKPFLPWCVPLCP